MTPTGKTEPRFQAIAFDLDGTLIDTEAIFSEAARRLLADRGKEFDPVFMATIMGTPGRDSLPRFRERYQLEESIPSIEADYRKHFFGVLQGQPVPLMPGAKSALERVRGYGMPQALTTSSRLEYVQFVLQPHGFLDQFNFLLTADDVRHGKPGPEIYLKAAERFGVKASELIVVEDSVAGFQAARAAGAFTVIIPHVGTPMDEVRNADLIVESLESEELWRIIEAG